MGGDGQGRPPGAATWVAALGGILGVALVPACQLKPLGVSVTLGRSGTSWPGLLFPYLQLRDESSWLLLIPDNQ